MLGLVETLVERTLGSLKGLGRGLGRQKLLKFDNCYVSTRCPRIYKKYNRPKDRIDSISKSIQLPILFLSSSFTYTHPIELGVGPLGS